MREAQRREPEHTPPAEASARSMPAGIATGLTLGALAGAALTLALILIWPAPAPSGAAVALHRIEPRPDQDPLLQARLQLAAVARERDQAMRGLSQLAVQREALEAQRAALRAERDALADSVNLLGRQVTLLAEQHREASGDAQARAIELARLTAQLHALQKRHGQAQEAFRRFVEEHTDALTAVLDGTGIEIAPLLERASEGLGGGQGGPLQLLGDDAVAEPVVLPLPPPLPADRVERLEALERLLQAMPLFAPIDREFRLTAGFGPRRDPFTRRRAMHTGLDFVTAPGTKILATAPGRVVRAGRAGAYGLLVEIDHGYGFSTLYAHLRKISVKVGDTVQARTPVGVIGSSGRSTGLHLHYEVRYENRPLDPRRFLAAGRRLLEVVDPGTVRGPVAKRAGAT